MSLYLLLTLLATAAFTLACTNPNTSFPTPTPTIPQTISPPPTSPTTTAAQIIITAPQPNTVITSPLTVTGQAPGTWMFEANLPIEIQTSTGQILGQAGAQAQSDWMTEAMVPFTGTITFTVPPGTTEGFLVIKKDNPSGLPENDASARFPIRFK